jgi:hypothetical protein
MGKKIGYLILLVLFAFLVIFMSGWTQQIPEESIWQDRIDASFGPVNCSNVEHNFNDSYAGPLIDTHIHMASIPDDPNYIPSDDVRPVMGVNVKIADYICMLDNEGTAKVFGFFPVWNPIRNELLDIVSRTMVEYPDRFVPFIMPPDNDDSPDGFPTVSANVLSEMLDKFPNLFKGYGEIGLYARGDHDGPTGALALSPDSNRLQEIYPIIREHKLLVYFHLGEGQQEDFERVLEENSDINFIFHGDQLVSYEHGEQNLEVIDKILNNHPNAYYGVDELYGDVWLLRPEVSKEEFFMHFKDYEPLLKKDIATWKGFIERHPDQVLWGTDRGWSAFWTLDSDVGMTLVNYSRTFISKLDPSVQENFAYKNAERLISGS